MGIDYEVELQKIFGDKYEGCTQNGDGLVEYRLKPERMATPEELSKVVALPKGMRAEIDPLKTDIRAIKERLGIV